MRKQLRAPSDFKTARESSRATPGFFPINPSNIVRQVVFSMKTSFNGADFEQTNRFQFRLNIHLLWSFCASVYASARMHPHVCQWCLFRSRTVETDSAPSASARFAPLDCIDHRWRGCTRQKRLVTQAHRIVTSMSSHVRVEITPAYPRIFACISACGYGCSKLTSPLFWIRRIVCCHRVRASASKHFLTSTRH